MDGLNHFFISRVLGATMRHTTRPGFGPLGQLHAQHQRLAQRLRHGDQIALGPSADSLIERAFIETRQGFPIDRVLADPALTQQFLARCQQLGLNAPPTAINRRLFQFRKNSGLYGVTIPRATKRSEHRDYSPYLFAAEMAIVQMKYRFGASVDDILVDLDIGTEFDRIASGLVPGWNPVDYRLAALHVRKSRHYERCEKKLFESLRIKKIERKLVEYGPVGSLKTQAIKEQHGILALIERDENERFLYVIESRSVQDSAKPFLNQTLFDVLANAFWSPSVNQIHLGIYGVGDHYAKASASLWEKRIIFDKTPVFNWPVHAA